MPYHYGVTVLPADQKALLDKLLLPYAKLTWFKQSESQIVDQLSCAIHCVDKSLEDDSWWGKEAHRIVGLYA